jgi:hypothetical protein
LVPEKEVQNGTGFCTSSRERQAWTNSPQKEELSRERRVKGEERSEHTLVESKMVSELGLKGWRSLGGERDEVSRKKGCPRQWDQVGFFEA